MYFGETRGVTEECSGFSIAVEVILEISCYLCLQFLSDLVAQQHTWELTCLLRNSRVTLENKHLGNVQSLVTMLVLFPNCSRQTEQNREKFLPLGRT